MASWNVKEVKGGNLIVLASNWRWKGVVGNEVIVNGYDLYLEGKPAQFVEILAKLRLEELLLNKEISLVNVTHLDEVNKRISCTVLLNGVNVADYFFDFKKPQ